VIDKGWDIGSLELFDDFMGLTISGPGNLQKGAISEALN
jgi:hypothetical protein